VAHLPSILDLLDLEYVAARRHPGREHRAGGAVPDAAGDDRGRHRRDGRTGSGMTASTLATAVPPPGWEPQITIIRIHSHQPFPS